MRCDLSFSDCNFTLIFKQIATNGSHLAYTLDSGTVGVVDLKTQEHMNMKTSHANVRCDKSQLTPSTIIQYSLSSVPMYHSFPTAHANVCDSFTSCFFCRLTTFKVVSGGYDSALLHFDFHLGSLLSTFQIGLFAQNTPICVNYEPPLQPVHLINQLKYLYLHRLFWGFLSLKLDSWRVGSLMVVYGSVQVERKHRLGRQALMVVKRNVVNGKASVPAMGITLKLLRVLSSLCEIQPFTSWYTILTLCQAGSLPLAACLA